MHAKVREKKGGCWGPKRRKRAYAVIPHWPRPSIRRFIRGWSPPPAQLHPSSNPPFGQEKSSDSTSDGDSRVRLGGAPTCAQTSRLWPILAHRRPLPIWANKESVICYSRTDTRHFFCVLYGGGIIIHMCVKNTAGKLPARHNVLRHRTLGLTSKVSQVAGSPAVSQRGGGRPPRCGLARLSRSRSSKTTISFISSCGLLSYCRSWAFVRPQVPTETLSRSTPHARGKTNASCHVQ